MDELLPGPSKKTLLAGVIFSFVLFLSIILFFGLVFRPLHLTPENFYWLSRVMFWIGLLILFLYVAKIEKQPFLLWGETKQSFSFYIVSFLAIICTIFFGSIIIALILKLSGVNTNSQKFFQILKVFQHSMPLVIFTCLTAGVVEEFVFRGYLMPRLQLLVKKSWLVIIISSALFGVLHFGYGTVGNVLVPFFIGAVFAVHYNKFRNIRVLMFCHFFWDFMLLLIDVAYYKNPHHLPLKSFIFPI